MNALSGVLIAGAVVVGSAGGWWLASRPTATAFVATPALARVDVVATRMAAPATTAKAAGATLVGEDRVDALTAYVALRDDADPKARLRLIEDWSRERAPGASLDLLTQAMVDPDEEVRARAQDLFERGLAVDARRGHELLTTLSQ
jgi:hypothetical protein